MELYHKNDVDLLKEKINTITDEITGIKQELLYPTKKMLNELNQIILDFIKNKKRKIYGGYAQNKLVCVKNSNDAFYKKTDVPDIDFYSPDPINDLIELSNILYNKGYKHVEGKDAIHKQTYSLFAETANICDISYVPANIYHRMPFSEIDGINYVSAHFTIIDIYRMLTEPYFSSRRWEKTFPRLYLLQKYYPFNKPTSKLPIIDKIDEKKRQSVIQLLATVHNFLKNNGNVIIVGNYAYNYLLEESDIMKDNN